MIKSFQANIWKIYLFNFLYGMHFVIGVMIPFFMDWGGISFFQITILQSWFVFLVFLLEIPTGAIADYIGRKTSLIISAIIYILGILVYTAKPDFLFFLAGESLFAIGTAFASGAYQALIYDTLKCLKQEKKSKSIFGKLESFSRIGSLLGAPLGSIVAVYFGLRSAFLLTIIPCFAAFIVILTIKEPEVEEKIKPMRYAQTMISGIKYFYSNKILKILAVNGIIISILIFSLFWIYQLALKELNLDLAYFGFVYALINIGQIIALNNFKLLEKIAGSKNKYLFLSAFISGVFFIFLGINSHLILAILAIFIVSSFGFSRFVLIENYMQKHIESYNRATVNSCVSMFQRFGLAITYPLIGLMVERSLSFALIIIGAAILIFSLTLKIKEEYLID